MTTRYRDGDEKNSHPRNIRRAHAFRQVATAINARRKLGLTSFDDLMAMEVESLRKFLEEAVDGVNRRIGIKAARIDGPLDALLKIYQLEMSDFSPFGFAAARAAREEVRQRVNHAQRQTTSALHRAESGEGRNRYVPHDNINRARERMLDGFDDDDELEEEAA